MKLVAFAGVPGAGKDTAVEYLYETYPNVVKLKFATPLQDLTAILGGFYDEDYLGHRVLFNNRVWKENKHLYLTPVLNNVAGMLDRTANRIAEYISNNTDFVLMHDSEYPTQAEKYIEEVIHCNLHKWFDKDTAYSPRDLLKVLGTDFGRCFLYEDIWVDCLLKRLDDIRQTKPLAFVTVSDLRRKNEAKAILNYGGHLAYILNMYAYLDAKYKGLLNHESEMGNERDERTKDFQLSTYIHYVSFSTDPEYIQLMSKYILNNNNAPSKVQEDFGCEYYLYKNLSVSKADFYSQLNNVYNTATSIEEI